MARPGRGSRVVTSGALRVLADMGVSGRVVAWLRAEGHDAVHLRDEGFHRLPDEEVFAKALRERRVVLTFDLGFGEIAAFSGARPVSVVVLRLRQTRERPTSSTGCERSWHRRVMRWMPERS